MESIVKAVQLLGGHTIRPADEALHKSVIAAVMTEVSNGHVNAFFTAYAQTHLMGDKYWAKAFAALLIQNYHISDRLLLIIARRLHDGRMDELHGFIPVVMIGVLEAAAWQATPNNPRHSEFLRIIPGIFGQMFVDYTDGSGHGCTPCTDWAVGAFNSALSSYSNANDDCQPDIRWHAREIIQELKKVKSIGDDVQKLYSGLTHKLFGLLDLVDQTKALDAGFFEPFVPA